MSARLELHGVTRTLRTGWRLGEVSLRVEAGTLVAIGGPNGSGKSTLLRCIAGLDRHDGTVVIDGVAQDGSPASRRLMSYLPQTIVFPEHATVGEAIALFASLRDADPAAMQLPDGFVPPASRSIATLSGGERQRVGLAVALLGTPRLLLFDEPVASLDEDGRDLVWSLLRRRCRAGASVVVATPSPSDLAGIADRVVQMRDGQVIACVTTGTLRAEAGA